ncbi:hypothetical protein KBZ10_11950 [Streptomyces sp. F63]|uniref:hypothetical protein n=1 Tax=Streptomyces sp. F63 TaxID=2824887 RepID=UPI001B3758D3|nr:hypothetical protein [Streptomyces sp. F63]MBQ0985220.1 hypothetical protein [Streptomyces sp. F63]
MDAVRVALLREVLAGTAWLDATRRFAGALRHCVDRRGGGLLLTGGAEYEPWHLAAHLDDEAAWSGLPQLSPTLVRHRVRPGEPAHLAVGPARLEAVRRGETLLVVTPEAPGEHLLERVRGARRAGATVLAVDGGDRDLRSLAHETLTAPGAGAGTAAGTVPAAVLGLDTVQHLVSAAAGENGLPGPRGRRRFRDRLSRLAGELLTPPPARW